MSDLIHNEDARAIIGNDIVKNNVIELSDDDDDDDQLIMNESSIISILPTRMDRH